MKPINKHIKLFTLIGITATIIGYIFLIYQGYTLNNDIIVKRGEINKLELLKVEKVKELAELENKIIEITSTSNDTNTVKQGMELAIERGIPIENHFKPTSQKESSLENAEKYEKLGFEALLNKDISASIEAFIKSENSSNGYHSVYDIAKYLIKNQAKLSDKNSDYWGIAYKTISSRYNWKMPVEYKSKFKESVNYNIAH